LVPAGFYTVSQALANLKEQVNGFLPFFVSFHQKCDFKPLACNSIMVHLKLKMKLHFRLLKIFLIHLQ